MQTALAELMNYEKKKDDKVQAHILLDSGSQRTYIAKEVADKLDLKAVNKSFLTIYTFGMTKPRCIVTKVVEVDIVLKSGFRTTIKANIVPEVTGTIEKRPIQSKTIKKTLEQYELADKVSMKVESYTIDLLIGNDYYADIVSMNRTKLSDGLYLISSNRKQWIQHIQFDTVNL